MAAYETGSIDDDATARHRRLKVGADHWLSLAAAPTFAVMAMLTGIHSGRMPDMLCPAAPNPSPLTGMVPMYVLMTAFHLAPWLSLFSDWSRPFTRNR